MADTPETRGALKHKSSDNQECDIIKRTKSADQSLGRAERVDNIYFGLYENIDIHAAMLADKKRTSTYRLAIYKNHMHIRGKVVMDIGAGTGILSVFCAQVGAKKVYAIEGSSFANEARKIVKANNFEDKIEVIQKRVEELDLDVKVDVIISEWMGYLLLYENMLPSVLYARDKWLKGDGIILPGTASIYIAPCVDSEGYNENIDFWDEVEGMYGVKMSCLKPFAQKSLVNRIYIREIHPEDIMAHAQPVFEVNLKTMPISDIYSFKPFELTSFGHAKIHGFVLWFDVQFPNDVVLSTAPFERLTHWEQTLLYVDDPFSIEQDTIIDGEISMKPNIRNKRFLDVKLKFKVDDLPTIEKNYYMNDDI